MNQIDYRFAALVLTVCLALTGCGADEHKDIQEWMKAEQQNMHGRIQPLPQIKTFPVVAFDSAGVTDPFVASRVEPSKKSSNMPDKSRRREPLEEFPLESLRMVGMMQSHGRPVAMILADKAIYSVKVGNYIGQNFGQITRITETELSLKELIEDANGDWVERVSTMQLQEQGAK